MKLTRILALLLAVLTVAAVFAACGKTPEPDTTAADTTAAAGIDDTTAEAIPTDDTTAEAAVTEAPATAEIETVPREHGCAILPVDPWTDGFYLAVFIKQTANGGITS